MEEVVVDKSETQKTKPINYKKAFRIFKEFTVKAYKWAYGVIFQNLLLLKQFLSFVISQLKSQIEIMKDVNIENNFTILLIWSSLFLSIFSGYTTWKGIDTLSNVVIAFIGMLGIQIMLFVSSWKMSFSFVRNNFSYSSLLIFIITLVTSTGFSYVSLFTTIFDNKQKVEVEKSDAKGMLFSIINEISGEHSDILDKSFDNNVYLSWKKTIIPLVNESRDELYDLSLSELQKSEKFKKKAEREFRRGGIHETEEGKKITTDPGDGEYHKKLQHQSIKHKKKQEKYELLILDAETLLVELPEIQSLFNQQQDVSSLTKMDSIISRITSPITFSVIAKLKSNYDKQLSLMFKNKAFSKISTFNNQCSGSKVEAPSSKNEILSFARTCILLSHLTSVEKNKYIRKISTYERYNNQSSHKYMTALSELKKFNPLAMEVLFLASIFDLLILFSSFIGARIENYSDIKSIEDLGNMGEKPILTSLGANLDRSENDTKIQKRIKRLLKRSIFSSDSMIVGYPTIILDEEIQSLGLQYVLLVFIQKNYIMDKEDLLERLNDTLEGEEYDNSVKNINILTDGKKYFGISLVGILWMLDYVQKSQESVKMSEDMKDFSEKVMKDI